jgi:hypothetical protein
MTLPTLWLSATRVGATYPFRRQQIVALLDAKSIHLRGDLSLLDSDAETPAQFITPNLVEFLLGLVHLGSHPAP